ncbi:MAG: hypothetical protein ABI697_02800 [Devosia sp.]
MSLALRSALVVAGLWMASGVSAIAAAPCPPDTYASDALSGAATFSAIFAPPTMTCSFSVAAPNTDPDTFVVYGANYRGALLDEGDTGTLTVRHNGRADSFHMTGDFTGQYTQDGYVGKEADGTLRSTVTVGMDQVADPSLALITLDSADYTEVATMTKTDAEDSMNSVGLDQVGLVTHLGATAGLLAGQGQPLEGDDEVGLIGGAGSLMFGARARYNLADGYSVLGGVSLIDQSPGAHYGGAVAAAAFRYVQPDTQGFRLVGEVGGQAGLLSLQFTRSYSFTDTSGAPVIVPVTVTGSGTAVLGAIYGKVGAMLDTGPAGTLLLSATLRQTFLGFASYQEPFSSSNLFAADLGGKVQSFTTATLGADWTVALARDVALTSSLAVGTTIANNGAGAYLFGGGDVAGTPQSTLFAQYGLNLGWEMSPQTRLDTFVQGSTGAGIGTHAQVGAAYSMRF